MGKEYVNPVSLFPSVELGFSQVIAARGSRTVFMSGQTAWDVNRRIVGETLGDQAVQALRNVKAAIEAAGGSLADIVALRVYMVNHNQNTLEAVAKAVRDTFPTNPPTSTWIGVASLAMPEFLIEVEATAVLE